MKHHPDVYWNLIWYEGGREGRGEGGRVERKKDSYSTTQRLTCIHTHTHTHIHTYTHIHSTTL